jgi:hypothetical protein
MTQGYAEMKCERMKENEMKTTKYEIMVNGIWIETNEKRFDSWTGPRQIDGKKCRGDRLSKRHAYSERQFRNETQSSPNGINNQELGYGRDVKKQIESILAKPYTPKAKRGNVMEFLNDLV